MATLNFVRGRLAKLISEHRLSIRSSEAELRAAIRGNLGGKRQVAPGVTLNSTKPSRGSVFPEWVKTPRWNAETGQDEWVNDHRWGEGSNEREDDLYWELTGMLFENAGMVRIPWDALTQYGHETVAAVQAVQAQTRNGRGPGSPYAQNTAHEFELVLRLGGDLLLSIFSSAHWKAWADIVEFMYKNPGYEELGPWHYVFVFPDQKVWNSEQGQYVEATPALPNEYALDAVRQFSRWASHAEMARVIGILARNPQDVTFQKFFKWVTTHKNWKNDEEADPIDYVAQAAYVWELLDTAETLEEVEAVVQPQQYYGIISYLRYISFGWQFNEESRQTVLEVAKSLGFATAWRSITIERSENYLIKYANHAATMWQAIEKLGCDTVLRFIPAPEGELSQEWMGQFEFFVAKYVPQEGLQFTTYEEFVKRATVDSLGENPRQWYNQLVGVIGDSESWKYFTSVLGTAPNYYGWEQKANYASDKLAFVPVMIEKLDANSIQMIIAENPDVKMLGQLVEWYKATEPKPSFSTFKSFVRRATRDGWGPQIIVWFDQLVAFLGDEEAVWDYFIRSKDSGHDAFFFIPKLVAKLDVYSVRRIIGQVEDVRRLASTVDAYQPEAGLRFDGWRAFLKHVELQRTRIVIPGNDPVIEAAVKVMLEAPGLDVSALKAEIQTKRFAALARGENDADAILQPAIKMYYLTPAAILIRQALGTAGKAAGYKALRAALNKTSQRAFTGMQQQWQKSKADGSESAVKPFRPDFAVEIPKDWEDAIDELLQQHDVNVREFASTVEAVRYAIGVAPTAADDKKLFWQLDRLAKDYGIEEGIKTFLQSVPTELEDEVLQILLAQNVPMGPAYKVEILKKSDPRGWVAPNWVVCRATFGSSKNWDYMYQRGCSPQIVSLVNGESERILAWSVIVASIRRTKKVDPKTATIDDVDAWVSDNIEAANNYASHFPAVSKVNRRFWNSVTNKRVMQGAWHNDIVTEGAIRMHSGDTRNQWMPLEPLNYSDFFGAAENNCYLIQEAKEEEHA